MPAKNISSTWTSLVPNLLAFLVRISLVEVSLEPPIYFGVKVNACQVLNIRGSHTIAQSSQPYGNSRVLRDHTVLPATRQRRRSRYYHSLSLYSRDERLSLPEQVDMNILLKDIPR